MINLDFIQNLHLLAALLHFLNKSRNYPIEVFLLRLFYLTFNDFDSNFCPIFLISSLL